MGKGRSAFRDVVFGVLRPKRPSVGSMRRIWYNARMYQSGRGFASQSNCNVCRNWIVIETSAAGERTTSWTTWLFLLPKWPRLSPRSLSIVLSCSLNARGMVFLPSMRHAATMRPWQPLTRTSRPSFDAILVSFTARQPPCLVCFASRYSTEDGGRLPLFLPPLVRPNQKMDKLQPMLQWTGLFGCDILWVVGTIQVHTIKRRERP